MLKDILEEEEYSEAATAVRAQAFKSDGVRYIIDKPFKALSLFFKSLKSYLY